MTLDLRERLDMTRHVHGCALFSVGGDVIGALGAESAAVEMAGHNVIAFLRATGAVGEPSLAAALELEDGALFVRAHQGEILVVKTDGAFEMTEACFDALVEALTPRVVGSMYESGVRLRESGVVARGGAPEAAESSTNVRRVG